MVVCRFDKYSVAIQKTKMESNWKARNVRPTHQSEGAGSQQGYNNFFTIHYNIIVNHYTEAYRDYHDVI